MQSDNIFSNIDLLVQKIDAINFISIISNFTTTYLYISVGELFVITLLFLIVRLFNRKLVYIIVDFIFNMILKIKNSRKKSSISQQDINIKKSIKGFIKRPIKIGFYTLAFQLSLFILVSKSTLGYITPWINTFYIALFTWIFYFFLDTIIGVYSSKILTKYKNIRKDMIIFISRIIKVILVLIVLLFLFSQLGVDIKAIAASLGVGGIAIALASKDTLANFFSSLNIMTDNSFSQGDWIKTDKIEGTVVDIRMRTTRIRTFDNSMITVPNAQLANTYIQNWSKRVVGRRIKISLCITYESKMEDIIRLKEDIYNMLLTHKDISNDISNSDISDFQMIKKEDLDGIKKTLFVHIDEFGSSSINILIYCFSKSPEWLTWLSVKEDVMIKISSLVEKNSCEIAYPTQSLFIKK